ncbi:conserved hypothetical protein [Altererythrobacter sp. B11]|uniref:PdaC/SigV domain-containing protein n=1 Tax=Altererythrobacter sp. B11 TaxID=2060312 RepID=UPI000DC6E39C|nr:DUF4163 domain-containing protein [Altererythrobacter sp. B11]BBC74139.1 conserved hypothetical protein [Altererythrobacter sp. B11]
MLRLISICVAASLAAGCTQDGAEQEQAGQASPAATASAEDGPVGSEASASATPEATATDPEATATATATASAAADRRSNGARSVSEETDDYLFEYSYPAAAGKIPELAALLDKRLDERKADLAKESVEAREEARDNGFPYNKHSYNAEWKVVANLPDWLSLSSEVSTYSGGAHGNYGYGSLVWNKADKRAIEAEDMFLSDKALDKALGEKLCDLLNAERKKRRGPDVPDMGVDEFTQCVPVSDATVLVGSRGGKLFDRVGIIYGPYAAGPYAEGSYELTLPVTRAVLDAVKPRYKAAFAARN